MGTPTDYALASLMPYPSVWSFYPTLEAAAAKAEEANAYSKRVADTQGEAQRPYEPMTYQDYKAAEHQFYLSRPLKEISEERFNEAYEVLPPMAVRNADGVFSFLMIEHWSGPYTSQYAAFNGKHFTRLVDATDPSSWITRDEINSFLAGRPQIAWQRRITSEKQSIEIAREHLCPTHLSNQPWKSCAPPVTAMTSPRST
jgi:hypothetical protein